MDAQKVDMYLMSHAKFYESRQIPLIREMMLNADDSKMYNVQLLNPKDPTMLLIISILVGHFGVDRFLIGEMGLGLAKLLTCGGFGVWTLVDWFLIMGRTKEVNFWELNRALM